MILIDLSVTRPFSHLVGSTIQELHEFARLIAVRRCWFHNPRGKHKPHYDLRPRQAMAAVVAGATVVDQKTIVTFLKKQYADEHKK